MGKRIVQIDPELLQGFITQDNTIGDHYIFRTIRGVPVGAKIVRCWVRQEVEPHGVFVILFEHESWPETPLGEPYEVFVPEQRAERLEATT